MIFTAALGFVMTAPMESAYFKIDLTWLCISHLLNLIIKLNIVYNACRMFFQTNKFLVRDGLAN